MITVLPEVGRVELRVISSTLARALYEEEWSTLCHGRFTPLKTPGTSSSGGRAALRAGLDVLDNKNLNPGSSGPSV